MRYWNDEFLTERNKKDKPFGKSMMINGLIVPIDLLESESQEENVKLCKKSCLYELRSMITIKP